MMKIVIRPIVPLLALAAAMVSGCIESTDRGLTVSPPAYTDPTRIELLSSEPQRPYMEVGRVNLETGDWRTEQVAETKIRTEAAQMMADAVIVYGRTGPRRAIAIRYTDTTPPRGTTIVTSSGAAASTTSSGGSGNKQAGGGEFPEGGNR